MSELLGTNRGFELGTVDQWTVTTSLPGSGDWGSLTIETSDAYEGSYSGDNAVGTNAVTGSFTSRVDVTSARVAVKPKRKYTLGVWVRLGSQASSNFDKFTFSFVSSIKWYDASNSLIQTDTLSTTIPGATWRYDGETVNSPDNAAYAEIFIRNQFSKASTTNTQSGSQHIFIDSASIKQVGGLYLII